MSSLAVHKISAI